MTTPTSVSCPACGAASSGRFCSACGTSLGPRTCTACRAELSAQARFCHRCGHPAGKSPASDRKAWVIAGLACLLLVGGIAYKVTNAASGPVAPDMANAGSSTGLSAGPAPDISQMSPRERFDRLYDRIMRAAGRGDSGEVMTFTPMALGAYDQLDSLNADARYHAGMLHAGIRQFPAALALADTILSESPGHLFGYVIRGEVGRVRPDKRLQAQAYGDFLAHYRAEMRANRVEYLEHKPALDEFKGEAEGAVTAVQ